MHDLLILKGNDVIRLLDGRELEIISIIESAYRAHDLGCSSLPHSSFLRFPQQPSNRIIALPTYLGGEFNVAGIKWIASFPANIDLGLDRASAVIIQNSVETGLPEAIIEGSVISARRTAASAALAARTLHRRPAESSLGLIGAGLINFETARFILAAFPQIRNLIVYDLNPNRGLQFREECKSVFESRFGTIEVEPVCDLKTVFERTSLVSIATTAIEPHITDISGLAPDSTILHLSLRDLSPEVILSCDNVVDDVDHACRAQTSVHLAEQATGARDFIRGTLAEVLAGKAGKRQPGAVSIFSPFGLGVLDLALSKFTTNLATDSNRGERIHSFFPASRNSSGLPQKGAL